MFSTYYHDSKEEKDKKKIYKVEGKNVYISPIHDLCFILHCVRKNQIKITIFLY